VLRAIRKSDSTARVIPVGNRCRGGMEGRDASDGKSLQSRLNPDLPNINWPNLALLTPT